MSPFLNVAIKVPVTWVTWVTPFIHKGFMVFNGLHLNVTWVTIFDVIHQWAATGYLCWSIYKTLPGTQPGKETGENGYALR